MINKCPLCGRKGKPVAGGLLQCPQGHFFDDEPNEGGDYSDRNPAARLERNDRRKQTRKDGSNGR